MQHKYQILSALFIFVAMFSACDDNSTNSGTTPLIHEIDPQLTYYGDTVTVFGENFGLPSDSSYIMIDTVRLNSVDCIKWNYSTIKFIVTYDMPSGNVFVSINGENSNTGGITIEPLRTIETVEVTSGSFEMGSSIGFPSELPVHNVEITHTLIVSKFEIPQDIFQSVMRYNNSTLKGDEYPVDNVSWSEAVEFCNKLSIIHKLEPCYFYSGKKWFFDLSARGWRLPTEAEWEYLCRANTTGDFYAELDDIGWWSGNSGNQMHPPGRKAPNNFDIYDMNGNVWEWCWDWYSADYYQTSPSINPIGPEDGERRVMRGGSWADGNMFARSANRELPTREINNTGIRIIRNK